MKGGEIMGKEKSTWNPNSLIDTFTAIDFSFEDKTANIRQMVNYNLCRLRQMFRYKGLPETIPQRDLEMLVLTKGFGVWLEDNDNIYCLLGSMGGGLNQDYMPVKSIVANPYLNISREMEIDKECVIMPNDSLYMGVLPILTKYANMLAENELTLRMVTIISRVNDYLVANDDKSKASAEKYINDLIAGKIGVIGDSGFMDSFNIRTMQSGTGQANKPISEFIELEQYFKGSMFNELGLKSQFNMKRESLNSSESDLNDSVLLPLVDDMLDCRQTAIDKINKMFGLNISVEFNSAWEDLQEETEIELEEDEQTDSTRVETMKEGEENEKEV